MSRAFTRLEKARLAAGIGREAARLVSTPLEQLPARPERRTGAKPARRTDPDTPPAAIDGVDQPAPPRRATTGTGGPTMPSTARKQAQLEGAIASEMFSVQLRTLHHSELNVRKTDRDTGIVELAEDIWANGLLNNLVVVEKTPGNFGVIAGDRRLQALRWLEDEHRIDGGFPVPVLIERPDNARQVSLSENLHRVALNAADEFEAFATIIAELQEREPATYADRAVAVAECARRQGVSVKRVEHSLRLAALAPDVLQALRAGEISIDAAKAYAAFDDAVLQLQVYQAEAKRSWGEKHRPQSIRDALQSRTCPSDDLRALYVGLIAYDAAGGRRDRDLFMGVENGGERLLDPSLLDKLAREKGEGDVEVLAKRDGFTSGLLLPNLASGTYGTWPRQPNGMVRSLSWKTLEDLPKKQRKAAIGVYGLKRDEADAKLHCFGWYQPAEVRTGDDVYRQPTAAEMAEIRRQEEVRFRAAHLAVGSFKGTTLEGRAFYPADRHEWMRGLIERGGKLFVTVLVEVDPASVEAMTAEAERVIAEEAAAAAAEGNDEDPADPATVDAGDDEAGAGDLAGVERDG